MQCSALQSASRTPSLCVCLLSYSSLQVCCCNRPSLVAEAITAPFVSSVQEKVRTSLPPSLGIARKTELPAQELLSFSSVFSSLFCFYFSCRKTKSCFNCRRLRCFKKSSVYLRSQFLTVTFSVASCVCQDTETSFFRIDASSELSLLSASDPFCSGSSSSSSSASILVCIVTSDSCFVYIIFVTGLQLSSLLIM